jgi:hypothetical protein
VTSRLKKEEHISLEFPGCEMPENMLKEIERMGFDSRMNSSFFLTRRFLNQVTITYRSQSLPFVTIQPH